MREERIGGSRARLAAEADAGDRKRERRSEGSGQQQAQCSAREGQERTEEEAT